MPKKDEKIDFRTIIKSIIKSELSFLIDRISLDFKINYKRKVSNWTLADFDSVLVAHMVFVSSFESKSGNMFQRIAREIAILKYGKENVPLVMQGLGITDSDFEEIKKKYHGKEQAIFTRVDQSDCQRFIANFKEIHKARGERNNRIKSTLNQDKLKEINDEEFKMTKNITCKPIDLMIYNPIDNKYYMMEIKSCGGLDSSNAPANVIKMLTEYAILGKDNVNLYFSTLYNFNGEGNPWTGQVKKYLSNEMLLIGKDFWEVVLPKEISFEELGKIYNEVTKELGVNEKINKLIKEVKRE